MLDIIIQKTEEYIKSMPKELRKEYGQFFTSNDTAIFMANMFEINDEKKELRILDPGAGTGILSAALIDRICSLDLNRVKLICYENDKNVIPLLEDNLKLISNHVDFEFSYTIIKENYILSQEENYKKGNKSNEEYDLVIGNPPYKKVSKNALEALVLSNVCYGAPNLYFLFMTMSIFNLSDNGELVYIIPRSWTSGAYFARFREYVLELCSIEQIHLFISRNKVFEHESVLQETMIIRLKKTKVINDVISITSSKSNSHFHDVKRFDAKRKIVINGQNNYIYLITEKNDENILKKFAQWDDTLLTIGLRMKTGLVVDFRNRESLRETCVDGAIPLFYAQNLVEGRIEFPVDREIQYVVPIKDGFKQSNKNYLIVKRFTSKEERRRIQCGIYLSSWFPQYEFVSTHNKVNFVTGVDRDLTDKGVHGLYVLFNSTLYDDYYRILNGSTQVNSTEVNTIPVPKFEVIEELGEKLMNQKNNDTKICDQILGEII